MVIHCLKAFILSILGSYLVGRGIRYAEKNQHTDSIICLVIGICTILIDFLCFVVLRL